MNLNVKVLSFHVHYLSISLINNIIKMIDVEKINIKLFDKFKIFKIFKMSPGFPSIHIYNTHFDG